MTAPARVTVLTNPMSGHGNAPHAAEKAVARFQHLGIDVVEIVGRDAAHARQLVDEALALGTDALVVVGGDGVIRLALQALARTEIPLGIIAAGTGNDHAGNTESRSAIPRPRSTSSRRGTPRPSTSDSSAVMTEARPGSAPSRPPASTHWSVTGSTG